MVGCDAPRAVATVGEDPTDEVDKFELDGAVAAADRVAAFVWCDLEPFHLSGVEDHAVDELYATGTADVHDEGWLTAGGGRTVQIGGTTSLDMRVKTETFTWTW